MNNNCTQGELLPGVDKMSTDFPQRMPYPEGNENDEGIYGRLTNGQRISGHLPKAIRDGIGAQSSALLRDGQLPPQLREMIIVRVGYHTTSIYEVEQHKSLALKLGVPQTKIDGLACKEVNGLDEAEAAAIAFVDALVTTNRVSDPVLDVARHHFSEGEIIEIIFVTGNWWTLARMLETTGIPVDEGRIGDRPLENIKQR